MSTPTPDQNYITEALLPCPFCGGEASRSVGSHNNGEPWPYIECVECACSADPDVWNRRAFDASRIAESERNLIAAKLIERAHASHRSAKTYEAREDGGDGSREQCMEEAITFLDAVAMIRALSPTPQSQAAEPTDDEIDRVACAIWESRFDGSSLDVPYADVKKARRRAIYDALVKEAKAAIAVIRGRASEPTDAAAKEPPQPSEGERG